MLGGGSNVLVSDNGVRGIVVLSRDREITQVDDTGVRAAAGLTINGLVRWTIGRGLAGIEAWAGTPGTVGGAIHGNAHFRGRNISDLIREVRVLMPNGDVLDLPVHEMGFGYDTSRLQGSGEVALSAIFNVTAGQDGRTARDRARIARVPQAHAAARRAERRLYLPESRPGARSRARRYSSFRRGVDRSRGPQGLFVW